MRTFLNRIRNRVLGINAIKEQFIDLNDKLDALKEMNAYTKHADGPIQYTVVSEGEAIRIVFLVQYPSIWSSWESVWRSASANPKFSVLVVLTPFVHPFSSETKTYDEMKALLLARDIPFCTYTYFDIRAFNPHVVFVQNPYDETRPTQFRVENLIKSGCRIAYIPYGLELGGGAWGIRAQFDLSVQKNAWRVFVRSERNKKMYGKYCSAGNSHVFVTGHPKFDILNSCCSNVLPASLLKKINGRKVILWTPHFSVGKDPLWSTFDVYAETIMEAIGERQNIFLLIRPHPLFFKSLRDRGVWTESDELFWRLRWSRESNIGLDESSDYHASFEVSHALMADVGSFLLEYLPTNKPILYLHCQGGLGMNDDGEVINNLYVAYDKGDVIQFIDQVERNVDPKKIERLESISEFIYGFGEKETAGARICKNIYESLKSNPKGAPKLQCQSLDDKQLQSMRYWREAETSFLAAPDYYNRKHIVLNEVLLKFPRFNNALDIGCGEGSYTIDLAKRSNRVAGYDINPGFILAAKKNAENSSISNIDFINCEIQEIAPLEKYDLVSCLGVTSTLLQAELYLSMLDKVAILVRMGGILLMIDTVSTSGADQFFYDVVSKYTATYREIDDYKSLILKRGFTMLDEITLIELKERNLVNKLFIFKMNSHQ